MDDTSKVLIVDDESIGKAILKQIVNNIRPDIHAFTADSGTEGLEWLRGNKASLIITDYRMPNMDGVQFIHHVRQLPGYEFVPIIMITVASELSVRHEALKAGASAFLKRPIDRTECEINCNNLLKLHEQNLIIQNKADWLARNIDVATQQIEYREKSTLLNVGYVADYRQLGEVNNLSRLSRLVYLIASGIGLNERECRDIEYASSLHDVGMVGVPEHIIMKNSALSDEEFDVVKKHAILGNKLLLESPSRYFQVGAEIALYHHERFDGGGYPFGLKGRAIPINARIMTLADVFDSLLSHRFYRETWTFIKVVTYIRDQSGEFFDPYCVDALLNRIDVVKGLYSPA